MRAWVVVLGDFGRSPRMQNHAVSLSTSLDADVTVIAYKGATPIPAITESSRIHLHYLRPFPALPRALFLFWAPIKVLFLLLQLLWTCLVVLPVPTFVFLQNPPALPTLFVLRFVTLLREAQLIVDWHNYAYTLMPAKSPFRWLAEKYERLMGPLADWHFCVSRAMRDDLLKNWGIEDVAVLYDRPTSAFHPIGDVERMEVLEAMDLTEFAQATIIGTATSFTDDEDIQSLIRAIQMLDSLPDAAEKQKRALFIISGQGPNRESVRKALPTLKHHAIRLVWAPSHLYPSLVASTHCGISLHTSSSGVDLPMKVVDYFGAGVPVLATDFEAIGELVVEGKTGYLFHTDIELMRLLQEILSDDTFLDEVRDGVAAWRQQSWESHWEHTVPSILVQLE